MSLATVDYSDVATGKKKNKKNTTPPSSQTRSLECVLVNGLWKENTLTADVSKAIHIRVRDVYMLEHI